MTIGGVLRKAFYALALLAALAFGGLFIVGVLETGGPHILQLLLRFVVLGVAFVVGILIMLLLKKQKPLTHTAQIKVGHFIHRTHGNRELLTGERAQK